MEEKKLTDEKVNATVKSLKWVCNQIPQDLGDSNEERMLKCIRLYCERGIGVIESQKAEIERLTEENKRLSMKVWNYEKPIVQPINYAAMVHCSIVDCYRENDELRTKNYELQKQVNEVKLELQGQFDKGVKAGCLMSKVKEQQAVKDTAKEIFKEIFESYAFSFKGGEDYKKGFCDALEQYDKQLRDLAKLKGVEVSDENTCKIQ